ncbi:MAG TPA: hypothetical protein PLY76_02420 [Flavobacteriales bacterium]|nr:hypothetical protein [Flavobacteriales bacterium]HRP80730.1 hypothetical protein [Flavobacteriales bacterium]
MHTDYDLLIDKLDGFIRKYYKDRLIRGALYSTGLLVLLFLVVALGEYFGRFGTTVRTALFWLLAAASAVVLVRLVALPLVKLFRFGKVIGHAQAAGIVGRHFPQVKDKLLNTLQLRGQAGTDLRQQQLIEASIAQRSRELGPVPFVQAIDLRRNRRYLRYAVPPVGVLLLLLLAAPSLITAPTKRLMAHGTEFLPEAPFRFHVLNKELTVPENEDFELQVEMQGNELPQQVFLEVANQRIPLVRQDAARFTHRFRNVQNPVDFRLAADGFHSGALHLATEANPALLGLTVALEYPPYLGLKNTVTNNTGDITVPAGTRITWTAETRSADRIALAFDDTTYTLLPEKAGAQRFTASRRFLRGSSYTLVPAQGTLQAQTPAQYRVDVVPDLYPSIAVEEKADSLAPRRLYFKGDIGDDHGFKRLSFQYRFTAGGDSVPGPKREASREIGIQPGTTRQTFFHQEDLGELRLMPGDKLEYWFEVWDNDGVNGPKSARSTVRTFEAPTLKELAEKQDRQGEAIKDELRESIKQAQDLQRDLDKLRRDMLDKKEANWQDKQKMQDILDRQQQLQQRVEQATEQLKQSQQEQQSYKEADERILQKQQQVQQLFENVLSEQMKELYRKVQEMLEKIDKEQLQEQMQDMKLSQEDIEKELDRALEQFKQMEVEQKAEDIADQLEQLAEKQQALSEETKEDQTAQEDLKQKQEELNKEFEDVRKQLDELDKKNQELERPLDLPKTGEQQEGIKQEQEKSSEQLDKKQNKKASDSQQKAGEQMQQLAMEMRSGMQQGQQEQNEEDMDALRQLLENILQLSFDQEANMNTLEATAARDPRLVDIGRQQKKLRDDSRIVEDSLFALSKRVPQLQALVNREMNAVNENMDQALAHLAEARANPSERPKAADKQQRAMTSLNNLALMLDEALQQMQQQQASGMPGSGNCNKPGGSGSSSGNSQKMQKIRSQQEALSKQLEQMRKALEKGQKPGEKPGQQNPGGMGMGMSQQLAQLAAQQAALRQEMQRIAQEMNKDGSGAGNGLQKLAEQMEQNEKDIVNKNITPESIRRQQDIMTRLLEAEKAERERELDPKRESNTGKDIDHPDPARFFNYQRDKMREAELLRTVPPGLKPYYKARVDQYFDTFGRP